MTATNLPADLPENWQQGQIVSPNGTDVGLTKQHGYNYMAEQINDTQEAVNAHTADTTNPHKATAEQVGAAISKDLASEKDLNNFVIGGIYRLGEGLLNGPNEHRSDYGQLLVINGGNTDTICQILCTMSFTDGTLHYRSKFREEAWSSWQELANAANFLPLDGSVAMTGNLFVKNGIVYLQGNTNNGSNIASVVSKKIANNGYREMTLLSDNELDRAINLTDSILNKTFSLFGEHNTSLLATTIQNLIQGGSISMIKSIQRGIITIADNATEGTATLAQAVNMSKAVVLFGGSIYGGNDSSYSNYWDARLVLSEKNKVNAARSRSAGYAAIVPYQVLEFA